MQNLPILTMILKQRILSCRWALEYTEGISRRELRPPSFEMDIMGMTVSCF